MFAKLLVVIALSAAVALAYKPGAPVPASCSGTDNANPVWTAAPVFVSAVPNGKLYRAGTGNDTFNVLHLWGTPYEMGYAQGQLLKDDIQALPAAMYSYIEGLAAQEVPWLPATIIDAIVEWGAPLLLQMNFNTTRPFTPQRYLDEMQGIADGAGVSVEGIQNVNAFPELTKAACTIVGATKAATPTGSIMHLRGLDFSVNCPIKNYAQVTVYHESNGGPVALANVGWAGMIGVLTGISNTTIGIGEKVWINHPSDIESFEGEPWMFVLRDALAKPDMASALSSIQNANRTCAIHVGIGDTTSNTFNGLTIAQKAFDVYNWTSLNWTGHPIIEDTFYWDKHVQPSSNPCLGELLQGSWGNITAETLALHVAAVGQTGDFHSVAFDYAGQVAYIANSRRTTLTDGHLNAYNRQYTKLDLAALWAVTQ